MEETTPATKPRTQLSVTEPTARALKAEINIKPSKPILITPATSAISPPRAESKIGVVNLSSTTKSDKSIICAQRAGSILVHRLLTQNEFLFQIREDGL